MSSKKKLKNRILSVGAAQICQAVLRAAEQLLLVRLYVHCWGVETYSSWIILVTWNAGIRLADVGLQTEFGNKMISVYAREGVGALELIARQAVRQFNCVALVAGVALLIFAVLQPGNVHSSPATPNLLTFLTLALTTLLTFPCGVFPIVYRAIGKFERTVWIALLWVSSNIIFTYLGLMFGLQPMGIASVQLVVLILTSLIFPYFDLQRLAEIKVSLYGVASLRDVARIVSRSSAYALPSVASYLVNGVPILIASRLGASPEFLVTLNVTKSLVNLVRSVLNQLGNMFGIEFNRNVDPDTEERRRLILEPTKLLGASAAFLSIFILMFRGDLYGLIIGKAIAVGAGLLSGLLLASLFTTCTYIVSNAFYFSTSKRTIVRAYLAQLSLSVLIVPLSMTISLGGAIVSIYLAETIAFCLIFLVEGQKQLNVSARAVISSYLWAVLLASVACIPGSIAIKFLPSGPSLAEASIRALSWLGLSSILVLLLFRSPVRWRKL